MDLGIYRHSQACWSQLANWTLFFCPLQHPYIFPMTDFDFALEQKYIIMVTPISMRGSLKDYIYQARFQESWFRKYSQKRRGLNMAQVQLFGRQVLEVHQLFLVLQMKWKPNIWRVTGVGTLTVLVLLSAYVDFCWTSKHIGWISGLVDIDFKIKLHWVNKLNNLIWSGSKHIKGSKQRYLLGTLAVILVSDFWSEVIQNFRHNLNS